jgi:hypothetical protein
MLLNDVQLGFNQHGDSNGHMNGICSQTVQLPEGKSWSMIGDCVVGIDGGMPYHTIAEYDSSSF